MSNLKGDIINAAFDRLRISGLTFAPGARENKAALRRLESLAARLKGSNICVGYVFEDRPDAGTESGVDLTFSAAFELMLASSLASDYGKALPPSLVAELQAATTALYANTAKVLPVQYPRRHPVGRGNSRITRAARYFSPPSNAPSSCETNRMMKGEVDDFVEDFTSYLLDGESIAAYSISSSSGVGIVSSQIVDSTVTYRARADGTSEQSVNTWFKVVISVTTSNNRVEIREINFEITL